MSDDLTSRDIPFDIDEIMHTAYLQYALSVNVGRAIPDVRDGLKPVNRRILYAMRMLNLIKSRPTAKCARVVGEVMGKYHPHGDAAIYDALVRLAQDFAMRYPLIEGQGNFGTIDGDPAAASRYTECRMERLTEELLSDIEKDTVQMVPNFDEEEVEPSVLPAGFPNLLVNGSTGIGVGMATNIPTHNLGEVINATIALMDNPAATVDELMEYLPGPDFPTGATIRGRYSLRQLYATGHGSVKLRAKAEIVEKDGREQIVITEIPYAVNKTDLVVKIADLVRNKQVTGISDLASAVQLGTTPTGNGRRESSRRKAYARMTNTFFEPGADKLEDMIASIDHGYMLFETNNGMEDPKNWAIQCVAEYGIEIVDGKLTDNWVSPVVMSGYVPDLLKSISMISNDFEVAGAGMCGKGYKEWVRVSDGGPALKVKVKLG